MCGHVSSKFAFLIFGRRFLVGFVISLLHGSDKRQTRVCIILAIPTIKYTVVANFNVKVL